MRGGRFGLLTVGALWLVSPGCRDDEDAEAASARLLAGRQVDDTAELQARLDAEGLVVLESGRTYRVNSRLTIASDGGGLVGDGTATLLMGGADGQFDNVIAEGQAIYAERSVGILAEARRGVILKGFSIRKEYRDGTYVKAAGLRGCVEPRVEDLDVSGFALGGGVIALDSVQGGVVRGNTIHDCHSDHGERGQITGIEIDGNLWAGGVSTGLLIERNLIRDLSVGPGFFSLFGWETDGITVANPGSQCHVIRDNVIERVGEGLDLFGQGMTVQGNVLKDCVAFGIKLTHGARDNSLSANVVNGAGLAGITIWGSDQAWAGSDTAHNQVTGNDVSRVNADLRVRSMLEGRWPDWIAGQTAGILLMGRPLWTVRDNTISGNRIAGGGTAHYAVYDASGALNAIFGNEAEGWSLAPLYALE